MPTVRILVADSDPTTSSIVAEALAARDCEISSAADGEVALRMATDAPPDLVILDPTLPRMDGLALLRTLRSRPEFALVPAIFLADRRSVEEHILGFKIGADDFMPKPVFGEELDLRVALALKVRDRTESAFRPRPAQGSDWSVVMSGFRGSLEQVGLPSLMSLFESEQKTGMLVVLLEDEKDKARLYFRDGHVVRAHLDKRAMPRNEELIYELLSRTRGRFDFRPSAVSGEDEIRSRTARLLLEGARRLDETQKRDR
jgi:DNA-binding response OmpR family regulator